MKSSLEEKQGLWKKIKSSKVAMLTSLGKGGGFHSRPMMTAQDNFDGKLYFFSRLSSEKIDEINHNENILITYSDSHEMTFVSVYGQATISRNPAKLREHWNLGLEAFFDQGVNDPDLCLIVVDVSFAEYWDSHQSQVTRIYELISSSLTGKRHQLGEHGVVQIQ